MTERENELLDAVEDLVKPQRTKVIQEGSKLILGHERTVTITVELPALLDQLHEAIIGSMVGIGGSGSLAHERNMLNSDALMQFVQISSQITDWANAVKSRVVKDNPRETLEAWYPVFTATNPELAVERSRARRLAGWKAAIEARLDPPRVRELLNDDNQSEACPVCGATEWWNPDSPRLPYRHPLVILYRQEGPDMILNAKGMCRACGTVWNARQLAFELEQIRDAPRELG